MAFTKDSGQTGTHSATTDTATGHSAGQSQSPPTMTDLRRLRRLWAYVQPYRARLAVGVIAGTIFGVMSGGFPKAVQVVFQKVLGTTEHTPVWVVTVAGLAIPLYFVVRGALGYLSAYYLSWVGNSALRDLRVELFGRLQRLSMDFFVRHRTARLIQPLSRDAATMQRVTVSLAEDLVKQPVTIAVAIGVLAWINPWFCVFGLVLAAVCLFPIMYIGRRVRATSRAERVSARRLLAVLQESFTNVSVIKAYLLESHQDAKFRKTANEQMTLGLQVQRQGELLAPLVEIIAAVGIMGALVYVYLAQIRFADFLAMVSGFYMMYGPLKNLGRLNVQLQIALASSESILKLLDEAPTVVDRPAARLAREFRQSIRYEQVCLEYSPKHPALTNVHLTIPCGSICAVVGPSGAGKSSVVGLLLRFYDPTRGRVLLDEQDIRELTTSSLRGLIGLVTQETLLFAESVADNIQYGRPEATRDEIITAARRADAHEFIMAMPQQYDTVLSDRGQNLSGGQRQRLAIARAFLKNPAILVLDEATSSLDVESEQQVQSAMAELMRDRTVIVIAHRLSTVRRADQIVVLDNGQVIETGRHDDLMQQTGSYRRMHDLQISFS